MTLESQEPLEPMESLTGNGRGVLSFEEIDQRYQLKIRAFIKLCMPPVFSDLEKRFDLHGMREAGVIPIMFYLQFQSAPRSLAFNGEVKTDYRVRLCRARAPSRAGGERLLLDMDIAVSAQEGSGDPLMLGGGEPAGSLVSAGRMRGVHVITRPVAPPGERQVTGRPEQLRGLKEHPWEEPYPTPELVQRLPEDCREVEVGEWGEQRSVWGLHNTDINQHVNVHEYITAMENHFTRLLFGGGLPAGRHRIAQASILFRKPFFMGDPHGLSARLYVKDGQTLLLGGFHPIDPEGRLEDRPSVVARMQGAFFAGA